VNYAEKHGSRAAERRFGSPPTEKMIREWSKQRKDLIKADVALAMREMEVNMTFYTKKVTHRVKTNMKIILVAMTTIFWVSMMNKLYYGC
jgi:hypothetical protein